MAHYSAGRMHPRSLYHNRASLVLELVLLGHMSPALPVVDAFPPVHSAVGGRNLVHDQFRTHLVGRLFVQIETRLPPRSLAPDWKRMQHLSGHRK